MSTAVAKLVVGVAGLYAARRYYRNWGTTKEECRSRPQQNPRRICTIRAKGHFDGPAGDLRPSVNGPRTLSAAPGPGESGHHVRPLCANPRYPDDRRREEAGGKGANLGELVAADLPVPHGFVVMRSAYLDSVRMGGVEAELAALHTEALTHAADTARLSELCRRMQSLVNKAGLSPSVRDATLAAYRALGTDVVVAVRSSATGEDGRDASFAGMNRTITNVMGEVALLDAVTQCWMSLFSPRVITYRASRGFTAAPAMAVVVQQMLSADRAGVAFTSDPSTGDADHIVIEAAFGQGEVVVSGKVEPDTYVIDKRTLEVRDVRIGFKAIKIVRGDDGADSMVQLERSQAEARVLDDDALRKIATLAVATETHNGCPQDIEWVIADGAVCSYRPGRSPLSAAPGPRPATNRAC